MYSVDLKQAFYLSDLNREYKYKVENSLIDFNGHLAEFGYYYYGVDGLRKLCEDKGCTQSFTKNWRLVPLPFKQQYLLKGRFERTQ